MRKHVSPLICLTGLLSLLPSAAWGAQETPALQNWLLGTILVLFAIIGLFVGYMFYLQRTFLQACQDSRQLNTFLLAPFGLPAGSVRAVIALILVCFALYLLTVSAFNPGLEFPEALAAMLTSVIGYYYGSRTAVKGAEESRREAVKDVQESRDRAVNERERDRYETLAGKVRKGLRLSRLAVEILPEKLRRKYDGVLDGLQTGLAEAERLAGREEIVEAAREAGKVFESFKKDNPVRDTVQGAVSSFTRVLGGTVPGIAVAGAVIGVGSRLAGLAYQKWKARILQAPFSPAIAPLKVVDANTGFTLLLKSPIFKEAFASELQQNDRPFMERAAKRFLQEDGQQLWTEHKDRFDSREEFELGLEQFRRAAADLELAQDIEPDLLAEVGGYDKLAAAVDRIREDPEAASDLDALVVMAEELERKGEPVPAIFDKIREELS
jgi:hypothetical protein